MQQPKREVELLRQALKSYLAQVEECEAKLTELSELLKERDEQLVKLTGQFVELSEIIKRNLSQKGETTLVLESHTAESIAEELEFFVLRGAVDNLGSFHQIENIGELVLKRHVGHERELNPRDYDIYHLKITSLLSIAAEPKEDENGY